MKNNTRNELISELDLALNKQAEVSDNHELISQLQSSLNSIDIDIERDFLAHKASWDILEKEKPRKEFINLESMRAGYHNPTLLKIHKKVLDLLLPAPNEKWEFSHYSSNQN